MAEICLVHWTSTHLEGFTVSCCGQKNHLTHTAQTLSALTQAASDSVGSSSQMEEPAPSCVMKRVRGPHVLCHGGFRNWDQHIKTMTSSRTMTRYVFESWANQPAEKRSLWITLQTLHRAETFALLHYKYKTSNIELAASALSKPSASMQWQLCLPTLQRQQEGDGRTITNLVCLSRNISRNNSRVTQDFNGYKEKSCSYSKNSTEEGNSLWVVPSLRLKEIVASCLTVTIQRNYSYSCRILLLPLKSALLFQNEPQRGKT